MDKVYCPYCEKEMRLINQYPSAGFCFYCECGATSPAGKTIEDAYARRPLQKPLTLEEACGSEEPCVYIEFSDREYLYVADVCIYEYDMSLCRCTLLEGNHLLELDEYGATWRCWATKPTQEEREAAMWNA